MHSIYNVYTLYIYLCEKVDFDIAIHIISQVQSEMFESHLISVNINILLLLAILISYCCC